MNIIYTKIKSCPLFQYKLLELSIQLRMTTESQLSTVACVF